MDAVGSVGGGEASGSAEDLALLKKAQDLAKQQSAALLATLPKAAPAPSPPGVGARIDVTA